MSFPEQLAAQFLFCVIFLKEEKNENMWIVVQVLSWRETCTAAAIS